MSEIPVLILLRREGSNLRPSGYEPDELPLLYFAMWVANVRYYILLPNLKPEVLKKVYLTPSAYIT